MTCQKSLFVFLILVASVVCLYEGDSCEINNEIGTCKVLNQCKPIYDEIRRAGSPMPPYLREKLQSLTCGYLYDDPLICCVQRQIENENKPVYITNNKTDLLNTRKNGNGQNKFGDSFISIDAKTHKNFDLLPTNCGSVDSDRIYGGTRTSLFEMPWMVLIAYNSPRGRKLSCGGTLINEKYVLTAAHCIAFLGSLTPASVIVGEYDVRTDPDCEAVEDNSLYCGPNVTEITIGSVVPHPGYTPQTLIDDIGLIRLAKPADLSLDSVKPICLPITPFLQTEFLVGKKGTVAGWGATESGLQSDVLLNVNLPVLPNSDCEAVYKFTKALATEIFWNGSQPEVEKIGPYIETVHKWLPERELPVAELSAGTPVPDKQICAGGIADKDACAGDSGGPLMIPGTVANSGMRQVQRGIVSYGSKRCGIKNFPGIYTRVASHMKWILDNMRE